MHRLRIFPRCGDAQGSQPGRVLAAPTHHPIHPRSPPLHPASFIAPQIHGKPSLPRCTNIDRFVSAEVFKV